jgi:hypothetical protein
VSAFLSGDVIQTPPEQMLSLLLDDCPLFFECFLIIMLLGQLHPFVEMFGSELLPILLVKFTLLFAFLYPQQYFSHAQPHWILNITSPSHPFQIPFILDLPLMPSND